MARGTDVHAFEMVKYTIFANEQQTKKKHKEVPTIGRKT